MSLSPGTRLGPYEILAPIGAGGMGEVYKARDTRLDRSVAVKVLSPDIASSPEGRQRFEREARTVSQLSHPHICAIYDVGHEGETPFLVMELLEGDTLADRLAKGPLPLEQALRYGVEMADALDNAHRQGIVHRDLKPGNVMLTKGGVKLLDFGLAKAFQPQALSSRSAIETSPPPHNLTEAGMFVGTLQYMAPEQVTGGLADTRSDIFALGTVLYEMATGIRAFSGSSRVALASAILNGQPAPMSSLRSAVSPLLDRLVQGCLAKDPEDRWQHARDVALQLTSLQALSAGSSVAPAIARDQPASRGAVALLPWLVAVAATAIALVSALRSPATPAAGAVGFDVPPPVGTRFAETVETVTFALSPDGTQLAMAAFAQDGRSRVWVRAMSSAEPRALAGTDGADSVFWSPDSRSIGFFAGSKLKRIDIQGGTVVPLCNVREGIGKSGTWGRDGQVLFATVEGDAIYRTSTAGETPVAVVKPEGTRGPLRVLWPSFLPDGQRFLYLEKTSANGRLMLGEAGKAPREVMPVDSKALYREPEQVVFAREGILLGQKLNRTSFRPEGEPFAIANPVRYFFATGAAQFSVSSGAALAYQGHGNVARIARMDRAGKEGGSLGTPGENARLFVSRDGQTAVFDRQSSPGSMDIWSIDLARGIETRLTSDPAIEAGPVLMPGGHAMIFGSTKRGGPPNLTRRNLDTGIEEFLLPFSASLQEADDVTRDGRTLLFSQRAQGGQYDLWSLSLTGSGAATPYLNSPADETSARFSPDGRFVAYVSNDSGRREVHVTPFPVGGVSTRVSSGGGRLPRWSADGRELFYLSADGQFTAVPIRTTPSLQIGRAVALFAVSNPQRWAGFDVTADGGFLAILADTIAGEQPLSVVLNWKPAQQ